MKSAFYYSPIFLEHRPPNYHPENPKRLEAITNAIKQDKDLNKIPFIEPNEAKDSIVALNHSQEHVERIKKLFGIGYLDPDTYFSTLSAKAAFLAAGAGVNCVDDIAGNKIKTGFCLVRPPGHHAEKDHAMGFCLLNNAAIAARYALSKGFSKIAIIDWDAHHGNGTQHSFYSQANVLYISLHHYPFYPGTGSIEETGEGEGAGFNINVPFPAGTSNEDYKLAFDNIVIPVLKQYSPDLIFISAGFDAHISDPLGGLAVDDDGFVYMADCLSGLNTKGTVLFLEGGYDITALADSAIKTFKALADNIQVSVNSYQVSVGKPEYEYVIEEVIKQHSSYWSL